MLFIDVIVVKVREGRSPNRSIYVAIGVTVNGECRVVVYDRFRQGGSLAMTSRSMGKPNGEGNTMR